MTVVQKFHYTWPDGVKPINFIEWINLLPEPEKLECLNGIQRQHEMRQHAIDSGDMTIAEDCYIWKDINAANKGKGIDDVWEKYWRRWQAETGAKFSMTFEEE